MNEENSNKAVELTDEEMDNISGGRAMIIDTRTRIYYSCRHKKISGEEFAANFGWRTNTCDHYDGIKEPDIDCGCCKHYGESFYRLSPNEIDTTGYDVVMH